MNRGEVFGRAHRKLSKFAIFLQNSSTSVAGLQHGAAFRTLAAGIFSLQDWKAAFPTFGPVHRSAGSAGSNTWDPQPCRCAAIPPGPDQEPTAHAPRRAQPKASRCSRTSGQEHRCLPHGFRICGDCSKDHSPPHLPRQRPFCDREDLSPDDYSERRYAIKSDISVAEGADSLK